ncbi:DNA-binding transcriptional MerR regulator [Paenibacillus shirakamiensis]|uniref:DNA-binding transcriptional MerR regulator n=1 Tax=Paenibacillus shirakamiensis TaxID=1265935 RepID=A0ABS4JCC9_9BACL|nr:MerR family transcriptional regulator [Paenibacillus shirakamiensis]MBP1999383.1 DNA-binding transcriptional MerR regulator [Paenibacillus shirakamiensis]
MEFYLRGDLAKRSGLHVETLRYYEKSGLLPVPPRTDAGYRIYPKTTLLLLEFIKNAKECGFTIQEIRKALVRSESNPVQLEEFIQVIELKLKALDNEISLKEIKKNNLVQLKFHLLEELKNPEIGQVISILHMDQDS